jgi:hypothetical protein
MKITKLFLAIACVVGLVASACAQFSQTKQSRWNLDLTDPKTSVSDTHSAPASAEVVTPTTGEFVFNFTITVSSTITAKIDCGAILTVSGDTVTPAITETENAEAVRSGNTATCTVSIPYSWNLGTPTTDKISVVIGVEAPVFNYGLVPYRATEQRLASIAVPANGATTTEAIAVTI